MNNKKTILIFSILTLLEISVLSFLFVSQNNKINNLQNKYNESLELNNSLKKEIEVINNKSANYIYEKNKNSVFEVPVLNATDGFGTVVVWDEDEEKIYFLTNSHVVNTKQVIAIKISEHELIANVEKDNSNKDVAILSCLKEEIPSEILKDIKVVKKAQLDVEIGDEVFAFGNNLGNGVSLTDGILSNKDVNLDLITKSFCFYQTTAAINNGASGGACFNKNGEFIGLITAKIGEVGVDDTGLFIPLKHIDNYLNEVEANIKENIFSSILVINVDDTMKNNGIENGAFVRNIDSDDILYINGLRNNDIIIKINEKDIQDIKSFNNAIQELEEESNFTIIIKRYDYNEQKYNQKTLEVEKK